MVVANAATAWADSYDLQIYKLGNPQCGQGSASSFSCSSDIHAPSGGKGYTPNANGNFRVFARQLAAGLGSISLTPPQTLGHAGFAFSAEVSAVWLSEDVSGAEGVAFPTQQAQRCAGMECPGSGYQAGLQSPLWLPSLHVRKGLPYSLELGGRIGWLEKSRMFVGGIEVKWALNEGFTYLPDIAIGGRLLKLINSRDLDLTTGGFDVSVGKQFAVAGMLTLTPYAGWNLMFVGASSTPVDFNPDRTLAQSETQSEQFKDIYVFDAVSPGDNTHNRFYGGLRLISAPFMIGAEFSYTVIGSFKDERGNTRKIPSVPAINFMIGVDV
jgi:hypothetical protein